MLWLLPPAAHLLAFGVAGGGVGLRVVLPLERALQRLKVVLAEGVRAKVLTGPAAAALGVDAQPAAVLVTWHPQAGRELSGDLFTHAPGQSGGADPGYRGVYRKDAASGHRTAASLGMGHAL